MNRKPLTTHKTAKQEIQTLSLKNKFARYRISIIKFDTIQVKDTNDKSSLKIPKGIFAMLNYCNLSTNWTNRTFCDQL